MLKKVIIYAILCLQVILIAGCSSNNGIDNVKVSDLDQYYDGKNNSFFQEYAKAEANYCFYMVNIDKNQGYSEVHIYFPSVISEVNFEDLKVYSKGNKQDCNYEIVSRDETSLTLRLDSYIPSFDCVTGSYGGKESYFYTGNYYFEQIDLVIDQSSYVPRSGQTNTNDWGVETAMNLHPNPTQGDIIVPEQVLNQSLILPFSVSYDKMNNLTKAKIELNSSVLKAQNIKRFCFEHIMFAEKQGKKNFILKSNNSFEIKEEVALK